MSWVLANLPTIAGHLLAHLLQAVPAIVASFVLAIPIARLARVARPLRAVLVTGSSLLYAVPSLALFVILPIILATADALDAVDARVLDAATAMGMGRLRCFLTVELPLAGPAILTGLRVVTVSTISLTTVGAVLGVRSLGWLFTDGFQRGITAEIVTGLAATAALALVLDGLVLALGRLCLPWTWKRAGDAGAVAAGACAAAPNSQEGQA